MVRKLFPKVFLLIDDNLHSWIISSQGVPKYDNTKDGS